jgi:hypothetical protein
MEATMTKYYLTWFVLNFWASPHHTINPILAMAGGPWTGRAARNALSPGFPVGAPEKPVERPTRPVPTDVPIPEPMDVPVPEPHDVPVPDPGTEPSPAKPPPEKKDRKPRSVP